MTWAPSPVIPAFLEPSNAGGGRSVCVFSPRAILLFSLKCGSVQDDVLARVSEIRLSTGPCREFLRKVLPLKRLGRYTSARRLSNPCRPHSSGELYSYRYC